MHPAQLRCSSVEWPAIRPSRALLDGRLVTRVGVLIYLRRLIAAQGRYTAFGQHATLEQLCRVFSALNRIDFPSYRLATANIRYHVQTIELTFQAVNVTVV